MPRRSMRYDSDDQLPTFTVNWDGLNESIEELNRIALEEELRRRQFETSLRYHRDQRQRDFAVDLPDVKKRIDEYIQTLSAGKIPDHAPLDPAYARYGVGFYDWDGCPIRYHCREISPYRQMLTDNYHLYANVYNDWIGKFVEWINGRKCLEVNARAGWIAGALRQHGVEVVATDPQPYNFHLDQLDESYFVEEMTIQDSIAEFVDWADILISCSPFHLSSFLYQWHGRPFVYIGEWRGGRRESMHDPMFFERMFELDENQPLWGENLMVTFPNDETGVFIGKINNTRHRATRRALAKSFDPNADIENEMEQFLDDYDYAPDEYDPDPPY